MTVLQEESEEGQSVGRLEKMLLVQKIVLKRYLADGGCSSCINSIHEKFKFHF